MSSERKVMDNCQMSCFPHADVTVDERKVMDNWQMSCFLHADVTVDNNFFHVDRGWYEYAFTFK